MADDAPQPEPHRRNGWREDRRRQRLPLELRQPSLALTAEEWATLDHLRAIAGGRGYGPAVSLLMRLVRDAGFRVP